MTFDNIMTAVGYVAMALGAVATSLTFVDADLNTKALAFSGPSMTLAGLSLVISSRKGG